MPPRPRVRRVERRAGTRPCHGDRQSCPDCGGPLFFHDGPAFVRVTNTLEPGWSCGRTGCGYRKFVRALVTPRRRPPHSSM
jgi:hypothetical protein